MPISALDFLGPAGPPPPSAQPPPPPPPSPLAGTVSLRGGVLVEDARRRQTAPPPATPFRQVLAGSVNVLMSGVESASGLVGGPILAAAVRQSRLGMVGGIVGTPPGGAGGGAGAVAAEPGGPGAGAAFVAGASAAPDGELAALHALQRESQAFNLQLLELQEQVQRESRHFSAVSNLLRAWHDTARGALANIRS